MASSDITRLLSEARAALRTPVTGRVVGERVQVLCIEHEGDRRGLVARVERKGMTHLISLADLDVEPSSPLRGTIAAYRAMLGIERSVSAPAPAPLADLSIGARAEVVVLAVKKTAARCRLVGGSAIFTLRCQSVGSLVPGEIATIQIQKTWRYAGRPYASGEVVGSRLEADRLDLVPLRLEPHPDWDPAEEYWGEEGVVPEWARPLVARGPRPEFEMEQVIPGADPTNWDTDPITEAAELREAGNHAGARALLMEQLEGDLRCLDAHAHLGNQEFEYSPRLAIRHYEAGLRIAELGLGAGFEGVLPWGLVDNRPFLRCLHGYGLCLWRLGRREEAVGVFERMLWLNPSDNQGARFLIEDARRGLTWEEQQESEEERANPYSVWRQGPGSVDVNMQDLMLALEDHAPGHAWYLDRESGELHFTSEDLPDEGPVTRDVMENDARFALVEPEEGGHAYRDMEEFVQTVREPALRQRLQDALAGKGAFGRFKRFLADSSAERERWLGFKSVQLEARARQWLAGIGVKPGPRAR